MDQRGRLYTAGGGFLNCWSETWLLSLWYQPIPGVLTSPAIGKSGAIYVGDDGGSVYAFAPDGKALWTFKGDISSGIGGFWARPLTVTSDETIYCISMVSNRVHAVKRGVLIRTLPGRNMLPIVGPEGNLYFPTPQGTIAESRDGARLWEAPYPPPAAIDAQGNLYISVTNRIVCLANDATLKWTADIPPSPAPPSPIPPQLALGEELVFGTSSLSVFAVQRIDGIVRWTKSLPGEVENRLYLPTVSATAGGGAHLLHFAPASYSFYSPMTLWTLGPNGDVLSSITNRIFGWTSKPTIVYSRPVIGTNGWAYFVYSSLGGGGILQSVFTGTLPANSGWNGSLGGGRNANEAEAETPYLAARRTAAKELLLRPYHPTNGPIRLQTSANLADWIDAPETPPNSNLSVAATNRTGFFRIRSP